jgi:hypothetical protein
MEQANAGYPSVSGKRKPPQHAAGAQEHDTSPSLTAFSSVQPPTSPLMTSPNNSHLSPLNFIS